MNKNNGKSSLTDLAVWERICKQATTLECGGAMRVMGGTGDTWEGSPALAWFRDDFWRGIAQKHEEGSELAN